MLKALMTSLFLAASFDVYAGPIRPNAFIPYNAYDKNLGEIVHGVTKTKHIFRIYFMSDKDIPVLNDYGDVYIGTGTGLEGSKKGSRYLVYDDSLGDLFQIQNILTKDNTGKYVASMFPILETETIKSVLSIPGVRGKAESLQVRIESTDPLTNGDIYITFKDKIYPFTSDPQTIRFNYSKLQNSNEFYKQVYMDGSKIWQSFDTLKITFDNVATLFGTNIPSGITSIVGRDKPKNTGTTEKSIFIRK